MSYDKVEVIVVGAGPAGTSAAYCLARAGVEVVQLERGKHAGSKSVMGGIFYPNALERLKEGLSIDAPFERRIIEQKIWGLTSDAVAGMNYRDYHFSGGRRNACSVLRAKFDRWFGKKAEDAGSMLITETRVDDLLVENGKVVGVRTDRPDGDLRADVVVIADGVNSLLLNKLGIRKKPSTGHTSAAVKEVIGLPREKIEERFNLKGDEGVAIEIVGEATKGMTGIGFLYTNTESISIGIGVMCSDLKEKGLPLYDVLEDLKHHPVIKPLLEGGVPLEYLAHLIPEGGYYEVPKIYGNGFVVAGDAASLVNAAHREGSNLAVESGALAAEAVLQARKKGDYSENALRLYKELLDESFVIKDLKKYRNLPKFADGHGEAFFAYPEMVSIAAREMMTVDGVTKREKQKKILRALTKRRSIAKMASDAFALFRGML